MTTFFSYDMKIDFLTLSIKLEDENLELRILDLTKKFKKQFNYKLNQLYPDNDIDQPGFRRKNNNQIYVRKQYGQWSGLIIQFPGKVADLFYQYIKRYGVPFHIFKNKVSLTRVDVCYVQSIPKWTPSLNQELLYFFYTSSDLAINQTTNVVKHKNGGRELRINHRKSSSFYRIYSYSDGLKFEVEMKKHHHMNDLEPLLFQGNISTFENRIIQFFQNQWLRRLVLDTSFTIWLVKIRRAQFSTSLLTRSLRTTYLTSYRFNFSKISLHAQALLEARDQNYLKEPWLFSDDEAFYTLLQLFSFLSTKDFVKVKDLGDNYMAIEFSFTQFFEYIGITNVTQPKRKKFMTFFRILPILTLFTGKAFDDESFLTKTSIPFSSVDKIANQWIVKLRIENSILDYRYPFMHSSYFINCSNKYDLKIKINILQSFNTYSLKKCLYLSTILQLNKKQSGQHQKLIKLSFLQCLKQLVNEDYIKPQVQLIYNNDHSHRCIIEDLNIKDLTKIKVIFLVEKFR
jgi:hypothetical protein